MLLYILFEEHCVHVCSCLDHTEPQVGVGCFFFKITMGLLKPMLHSRSSNENQEIVKLVEFQIQLVWQ